MPLCPVTDTLHVCRRGRQRGRQPRLSPSIEIDIGRLCHAVSSPPNPTVCGGGRRPGPASLSAHRALLTVTAAARNGIKHGDFFTQLLSAFVLHKRDFFCLSCACYNARSTCWRFLEVQKSSLLLSWRGIVLNFRRENVRLQPAAD